jgi:putative transposase
MAKREQVRKRYLSDLTDEQWVILKPMLPPPRTQHGGAPRQVDMRAVLDTLLYQNRTGCQWDMLPHDLLPKSTVYDYFAQWRDDGTWAKIVGRLRTQVRIQEGREPGVPGQSVEETSSVPTKSCEGIAQVEFHGIGRTAAGAASSCAPKSQGVDGSAPIKRGPSDRLK